MSVVGGDSYTPVGTSGLPSHVIVDSSALPAGAATSANQATVITALNNGYLNQAAYSFLYDNTGVGGATIYIGQFAVGTSTSTGAANCSIKKITYDANGNPTAVQCVGYTAVGVASLNQVWNNRASLVYA